MTTMVRVYRPPATPPVGEWARFLDRQHAANGWSVQQAFRHLHVGLQLSENSRASYDALAKGKRQPKAHEREYLTQKFGGGPSDEDRGPTTTPSADLVTVLAGLTDEIAALRQERMALWRGIAMALASPAGAHVAAALRDALAPLLPEGAPQ